MSAADLAALINVHSESGWQNVYKHHGGYRARVFHSHRGYWAVHGPAWQDTPAGVSLGTFRTPREAACSLVVYLRARYGPAWPSVWAARKRQPWRIRMARAGAFRAEVWLRGSLTTLSFADAYPFRPLPAGHHKFYFPHRPAARQAILAFRSRMCRRFALPPRALFWRPG